MASFLYYFEVYGYLFIVIASIFAMVASARVNSTFQKYSKQLSRRGITGAQAAHRVLMDAGVSDVKIARTGGNLTDHFNPKDRTIYLSDSVYDSTSTAAIGVAAHEAGHAVQHAENYAPIRIRSAIVPITNIGSRLSMPLIFIGLILSFTVEFSFGYGIALFGVMCFSLCVIFQLVTLPTEFNASARALDAIENGLLLDEDEIYGARKTLRAAAMTYVAALLMSMLQLLRYVLMFVGRNGGGSRGGGRE
jgi:Zn-dependent membrane protease YugP